MKSLLLLPAWAALALAAATTSPCVNPTCNRDNCLRALIPSESVRKAECSSFLKTTITPNAQTITVYQTKTSTPTGTIKATATSTSLVTATSTQSVVETDTSTVTATETDLETPTETVTLTNTVTSTDLTAGPPFKRAVTQKPTRIPTVASACSGSARYASACSCLGVKGSTVTAPAPKVTVTQTVSQRAATKFVTTTVTTTPITKTASTAVVTTTYSTETDTLTISTETDSITDATQTATQTATSIVPVDPIATVKLEIVGTQDPNYPGGFGYGYTQSFRGSTSVYYVNFKQPGLGETVQNFGINQRTGEVQCLTGPGSVQSMYYSTFNGRASASYVNISPQDFAVNQGGELCICKIDATTRQVTCKWGSNQIADLWTCAGRLNLVQPGFDFSKACIDATTSYKVSLYAIAV